MFLPAVILALAPTTPRALEVRQRHEDLTFGNSWQTTRAERCDGGMYQEPAQLADMEAKWKPFNDTLSHTGVAVYVQFSKVGSESMRHTMYSGVEGMRDTCFAHSGFHYRAGQPLNLKARHVVQGRYGVCGDPSKRENACSYFTLLRDPVATAVSTYTYFCQHCAESKRFCVNPNIVSAQGARCPDMSFIDFTKLMGNVYVKEFSGAYACADCSAADGEVQMDSEGNVACRPFEEACGQLHDFGGHDEHSDHLLERAKANMQRDVIPIVLEELYKGDGSNASGIEVLSMAYGWTNLTAHFATHAHSNDVYYEPSDAEFAEVRSFLAPDIALYEHARQVQHQVSSWLHERGASADMLTLAGMAHSA